jgi:hypothetical protein
VIRAEVETHAHLEHARRLSPIRRHPRNRLLQFFQIVLDGEQEALSSVGERQLACAPVKQPGAKIAFQHRHVPADCRWRKAEATRRGRETGGFGAADEGFEVGEGFQKITFNGCLKVIPSIQD